MIKTILSAISLFLISLNAFGTDYQSTGKVAYVVQMDPDRYGENRSHFAVEGFSAAGDCGKNDGLVAIAIKDPKNSPSGHAKSQLATILSAYHSRSMIHVRIDTDYNTGGAAPLCYAQLIMLMPK